MKLEYDKVRFAKLLGPPKSRSRLLFISTRVHLEFSNDPAIEIPHVNSLFWFCSNLKLDVLVPGIKSAHLATLTETKCEPIEV